MNKGNVPINIKEMNVDVKKYYSYENLRKFCVLPLKLYGENVILIAKQKDVTIADLKEFEETLLINNSNLRILYKDYTSHQIETALEEYIAANETTNDSAGGRSDFKKTKPQKTVINKSKLHSAINDLHSTNLATQQKKNTLDINNENMHSIVKGVNAILTEAILKSASDIHIEPFNNKVVIRYRIDGILQIIQTYNTNVSAEIAARIKVLSNLDISETRKSQDGRFSIVFEEREIDFRVSTILVKYGEKVVIRILDKASTPLELGKSGFFEKDKNLILEEIKNPFGMILVTGPTGSGKSTTLYSILTKLNDESVNISTIEDPVEYEIEGLNQVEYNLAIGNTFERVLKAFLRQDPDIIMIGEIRDPETTEIAIKASLTGHLVLSTLHTNSAIATIKRLIDMKVDKSLLATSLNLIISQRLVRTLCTCALPEDPAKVQSILNSHFSEDIDKNPSNFNFKKPNGCPKCGHSGFKGRTVIYEILSVNDTISQLILNEASFIDLERIAIEEGFVTIVDNALKKAITGTVSIDEIFRVL